MNIKDIPHIGHQFTNDRGQVCQVLAIVGSGVECVRYRVAGEVEVHTMPVVEFVRAWRAAGK